MEYSAVLYMSVISHMPKYADNQRMVLDRIECPATVGNALEFWRICMAPAPVAIRFALDFAPINRSAGSIALGTPCDGNGPGRVQQCGTVDDLLLVGADGSDAAIICDRAALAALDALSPRRLPLAVVAGVHIAALPQVITATAEPHRRLVRHSSIAQIGQTIVYRFYSQVGAEHLAAILIRAAVRTVVEVVEAGLFLPRI